MAETITHRDFGELRWEQEYSWWFTQLRLPSGDWLDMIVDPGDGDRFAFLEPAANLFRWALGTEQRILRDAIRAELLELYNDIWQQGDEPELTADELMSRLEWTLLDISASPIVPVTFSYDAGDLFGGHSVAVKVDGELRFRDIDLRG